MKRGWCAVVAALLLFVGCGKEENTAVGCWATSAEDDYYFQLYEDGTCVMFDADDEWVSEGTYKQVGTTLCFETDTGSFVWSEDPEEKGTMLFEAGDKIFRYRLQE